MFENAFPEVFNRIPDRVFTKSDFLEEDLPLDSREVFDHIRDIKDPEHPMTLEQLGVVDMNFITIDPAKNYVRVEFKPTIPHCSMATLIGLCIKVQLLRLLPSHMKVDVMIVPGTHSSFSTINKQLADKERVAAALENHSLSEVLNDCLVSSEAQELPDFIGDEVKKLNLEEHSKILYIRFSRQQIKSYRRWKYIFDLIKQLEKTKQ